MERNKIYLSIGGVTILLVFHSTDWLFKKRLLIDLISTKLSGFIEKRKKAQITIHIVEIKGIPFHTKQNVYYSLYYDLKSDESYETYYHISIFELLQLLQLALLKHLKSQALLLHASAALIDNKAVLFLGDSGAGKTTTINMLKNNYTPLADDSIIVKQEAGKFYCYQTPVIDKVEGIVRTGKKIPIGALIVLNKNHSFRIKTLSSEQCFPHLFKSLWLEEEHADKKATGICLTLLKSFKKNYYLSLKKNDGTKLIKELPKLL